MELSLLTWETREPCTRFCHAAVEDFIMGVQRVCHPERPRFDSRSGDF